MTTEPKNFRYFKFAEEAVRNVAETTAEMTCDPMELDAGIPKNTEMEWKGSMGRGKTLHRPGPYSCSPNGTIGTDIKILARFLKFALGNLITDTTEGAGDTLTASKVWYYDASGTSYASETTDFNSVTANDVNVPGHAAAEVGDYLAIGYEDPFTVIDVTVGTAKTDVSTIVFEYWDGSAWSTLSVTDATTGFTVSGAHTITFTAPTDWVAKKLSTDTTALYYVRARCSAFTSAGTGGALTSGTLGLAPDVSTQYIYSSNSVLLPSITTWMGIDITEHIVSGNVVNKLELTADTDYLTLKFDLTGQTPTVNPDGVEDEADVKDALNDDYPLAFYEVKLHLRDYGSVTPWGTATDISDDVKKLKLSVDNGISDKDGMRIGSRFPGYLPAGDREINLGFDYLYLSNYFLELLWGSTDGPQERVGSTEVEMMVEIDAGVYGSAQIEFPRVIVTAAPIKTKGRDANIQDVTVDAYQETVTVPTSPTVDVYTDCLVTVTLNFPDSTGSLDIPTWGQ